MILINSITFVYIIFLIFFTGLFGVFAAKRNLVLFLLSMEIIFLSASLMFSVGAHSSDDAQGVVFTIFLLAVVANEVAVGLALLIAYTRKHNISKLSFLNLVKG